MAIQSVKVTINGTEHTLEYNSSTQKWEKTITAPTTTSFNRTGGYYPVSVTATNQAGTSNTITDADNNSLKLVVKEKIKPTISVSSPSNNAFVSNSKPQIKFTVTDEEGGSGVDPDTIVVKLDGTTVSGVTKTATTNGYTCTYTPSTALSDGAHTVVITANDNDGNSATSITRNFKVDTVPPTLNITSPQDGLITNNNKVTITGVTNDVTSTTVTVTVKVNSGSAVSATVDSNGNFSKEVTLAEGSNTVTITAKDQANKTTTATLSIQLDTSTPQITNVTITPNPVDAGETMLIAVEVS